ncbi:anti-sigma regulatory factor (Ser/Thr protein kinase) [Motilibacter peucedani]|uniref:Anti-sigma regulatory factor (Ser/Thr protein kinase) n=1 Tax=Motilibacter peucedani TaxID=598650 RepID=A0A420XPY9_9ACTN|nr:ATP-binding protein [Motilibacter peucedani]RKS75351.1 anti-sigma regulatory factor (Ser/Thr protein kinase) [Motilibacter peucedani]
METTTVTVRFTALPAHVRTARLVAAAVARRSGVEESVLDEVRLAVGEACSRAVDLHRRHCPGEPVTVALTDGKTSFSVEVVDRAPEQGDAEQTLGRLAEQGGSAVLEPATAAVVEQASSPDAAGYTDEDEQLSDALGLAVISGLVDDLEVTRSATGLALRMTWPLDVPVAAIPAQH